MKINLEHITNDTIMSTDFARPQRIAFLNSIAAAKPPKPHLLAPGLPARGVWMIDVSAMDRRSVKAQLAGRADFRVWWWDVSCLVHRLLRPKATLEQTMFSFHRRHHALTLARLQVLDEYRDTYRAIRVTGVMAGIRCAIGQMVIEQGKNHE